jgi:hypothetical protein
MKDDNPDVTASRLVSIALKIAHNQRVAWDAVGNSVGASVPSWDDEPRPPRHSRPSYP